MLGITYQAPWETDHEKETLRVYWRTLKEVAPVGGGIKKFRSDRRRRLPLMQ